MFAKKKQALDFREIRRMLWRRKLLILVPILVTMAIATYQTMTLPDTYSSTATLAPENPLPFTRGIKEIASGGGEPAGGGRGRRDDAARTVKTLVMSSRFLESVAVQIGLNENPALIARAKALAAEHPGQDQQDLVIRQCVQRLRQMIRVSGGVSGVFNIQAVSASPRLAQIVATAVTEQYLQTTRQVRLRSTEEALAFARDQMAIYERQLEDKRAALNDYQRQMALKQASPTPVSKANLTRVNTMVQAAAADVAAQSSRQDSFRQRIQEAGLDAYLGLGVIESPKLDALKQTLYELERTQALAMVEQAEGVAQAEVSQTQSQIAAKSQQLLVEMETLAELALSQLDTDSRQLLVDYEFMAVSTQAARTREEELRNFLDKYAADLSNVPAEEFRLARLEEQVRTAERLYQTWLEQSNATQIAKAVQSADVSQRLVLLEPAQLPMTPVAPDRRQILLVALAMGIALGVGAAVLTEYFDLTLKSVDEIEAVLEAPILGAVPRMQAAVVDHLEARRRRRIWLFASTSVLILLAAVAVGVLYLNS